MFCDAGLCLCNLLFGWAGWLDSAEAGFMLTDWQLVTSVDPAAAGNTAPDCRLETWHAQ